MDGGKEIASGFVIASGDGSELFEFAEEVFDPMACFIEFFIMGALDFAVGLGRNDCRFSGVPQRLDHALVGVVALVGQQNIGLETRQQAIRSRQIAGLARREVEAGGITQDIDGGVNRGAQPALAPPNGLIVAGFFARSRCGDGPAPQCCRSWRIRCRRLAPSL